MNRPPGNRYIPWKLGDDYAPRNWTVLDILNDQILREWRTRRKDRARIWRGTQQEAIELAELMSKPAPAQLGTVSIVGDLDPPTAENAKQWAIYHNRSRSKNTRSTNAPNSKTSFHQCDTCHKMVRKDHQCT